MNEERAAKQLRELSSALGLSYEPQDWGILNADGGRLEEFVQYYEQQTTLSGAQKYHLGELVLASANERLLSGADSLPVDFTAFLVNHGTAFAGELSYWSGLNSDEEFPLAEWLRSRGWVRT